MTTPTTPPRWPPVEPATEQPSAQHPELDRYAVDDLVDALVGDQAHALDAVRRARAALARAVEAAVPRIASGGRLIYVGAGTSGRLGLLDSVELGPTFSWPHERSVALVAGGRRAVFRSVEGAEDHLDQGRHDLQALAPQSRDVVVLVAASGSTPYVLGALEAAREVEALTIALANNPGAPVTAGADIGITLDTGAELISGSTRLKAGTAQKVALNTLSSAIMVRLNKVYGNLMVDVQPTNAKLHRRAVQLTMRASGADEARARHTLAACNNRVKVAIVALVKNLDVASAAARLDAVHGNVRSALDESIEQE